ncbi:MAG: DUF547 domain-containing protein [Bacteroidia bacterium]|nr:DUF547 domain-containing protein [Bacteroidia bacterium]
MSLFFRLFAGGLWLLMSACASEARTPASVGAVSTYEATAALLLEAVRDGDATDSLQSVLATADPEALRQALPDDAHAKAFWINVYNSHIIILLRENPALFEDRGSFFTQPRVTIAGRLLSFDDIEHGIIRRSRVKLGLGLIGNPFADKFERMFRTQAVDPRVHFALNCGAKACPPVRVYRAATLDAQLDASASMYLRTHTELQGQTVTVTPLMSWFRGDFGGKKGQLRMLKAYTVIPADQEPTIQYSAYDWTLDIDNFSY